MRKTLWLLPLWLLTAASLSAQTTWTGATSTDWETAANWNTLAVPTAADDVVIPDVDNDPQIGAGTAALAFSVEVQPGAALTIENTGSLDVIGLKFVDIENGITTAFFNSGTVHNNGQMLIADIRSRRTHGLHNQANFNNNLGAELTIDGSTAIGLNNKGSFNNAARIVIGATASVGFFGLLNNNLFHNISGGEIYIDRASLLGLGNNGTFTNTSRIAIGTVASPGRTGLHNEATFNNTDGTLTIDNSSELGIFIKDGTFTNAASIAIGATAAVGIYGIRIEGAFNNHAGGTITIDRFTEAGISNYINGNFTNAANLVIGATANAGIHSLLNEATFNNLSCANLTLSAPFNNTATFTNQGLFTVNTTGAHSNTGFTNDGVLSYPQGNPIPNVTNNDVVIVPTTTCTAMLQTGSSNSFTAGTTWYTDPALTTVAGTYDASTNRFTATNFAVGTTYPLYFTVTDAANGNCTQTTSITATAENCGTCGDASNFTTTNLTPTSAALNWVTAIDPVEWQLEYKTTKPGSKWKRVTGVQPAHRSKTLTGLAANQNYMWHIRAKCGKTWTAYSAAVHFTTPASGAPMQRRAGADAAMENEKATATLRLYPNPSSGQFVVSLHTKDVQTATAKIRLLDATGRTILIDNAVVSGGRLQKTLTVPAGAAKGLYRVQILVNNNTYYTTTLFYTK